MVNHAYNSAINDTDYHGELLTFRLSVECEARELIYQCPPTPTELIEMYNEIKEAEHYYDVEIYMHCEEANDWFTMDCGIMAYPVENDYHTY